jgi:hypothetical protein
VISKPQFVPLAVIALILTAPAVWAQDSVFKSGASHVDGQVVNSYSNEGAVHYHKMMRVNREGAIENVIPPPTLNIVRPHQPIYLGGAHDLYSYENSGFQKLPARWVTYFNWDSIERHWNPAKLDLSELISSQARAEDIDPLLVEILIKHESNFEVRAASGAGARGLMQLMPGTAAALGIRDAFDPVQCVTAGTHYLAEQYRHFGDLQLALAAYNAGPGSVDSYGGIPPFAETQNYVSSITSEYESRRKKRSPGLQHALAGKSQPDL